MTEKPGASAPRKFAMTDDLRHAILDLAAHADIRSVSCPFDDFELWRGLLHEQVRRARITEMPPQEAFCLSGPDRGVPGLSEMPMIGEDEAAPAYPDPRTDGYQPDMWGGEIHIPFEGACGGDLFILPDWRRVSALEGRKLTLGAAGNPCNYLLTNRDLGEAGHATRVRMAGNWLYRSTEPYRNCNPFVLGRESLAKFFAQRE
jgi:hypothetical protein